MPTNVYFDTGTKSEQRLYEDLIIEQFKIYGQDVYYLPRKIANKDSIFVGNLSRQIIDILAINLKLFDY